MRFEVQWFVMPGRYGRGRGPSSADRLNFPSTLGWTRAAKRSRTSGARPGTQPLSAEPQQLDAGFVFFGAGGAGDHDSALAVPGRGDRDEGLALADGGSGGAAVSEAPVDPAGTIRRDGMRPTGVEPATFGLNDSQFASNSCASGSSHDRPSADQRLSQIKGRVDHLGAREPERLQLLHGRHRSKLASGRCPSPAGRLRPVRLRSDDGGGHRSPASPRARVPARRRYAGHRASRPGTTRRSRRG
jgi:hypothetical protein